MSVYYTKAEMESLYAGKLCSNAIETESYTIKIDSPIATDGMITFKRFMIGLVMIYFNLPNLSASPTGGYVQILSASDFPRKFRPDRDMYFMTADIDNNPRCVGILAENGIKIYASPSSGCYGVVSFIGTPMTNASMVSYYCDPAYDAVTYINNLGSNWSSFVVVTDTHGTANEGNSFTVLRFLIENSKAKMCCWLGDSINGDDYWNNTTKSQYLNHAELLLPVSNKVIFVYGNHERNLSIHGVGGLNREVFNDFVCDKYEKIKSSYRAAYQTTAPDGQSHSDIDDRIMEWAKQYYYFFDDAVTNTRYLIINTSQVENKEMDEETQMKWIEYCVQFGQGYENWNLVAFGHIDVDANPDFIVRVMENSRKVREALGNTNGRFVGYFCGHQHLDDHRVISSTDTLGKSINQVIFACDKMLTDEDKYDGYSYPTDRIPGTVNEQVMTIVSFNRVTRQVKLKRIGSVTPGMTLSYYYPV